MSFAQLRSFFFRNAPTVPASNSQIKTVKGLARASVKTKKGLALASIKTMKGLTNV